MILARVSVDCSGEWCVSTPYSEAVVAQFREVPGCRFDRARKVWVGAPEAVRIALRTLEQAKIAHIDAPQSTQSEVVPVDDPELRAHQRYGVAWLELTVRETGAALLADSMGLGKSAQALRYLKQRDPFERVLILCPPIVAPHWVREASKWVGAKVARVGRKLTKKEGGGKLLDWGGIGVCGYDTFRGLKGVAPADVVVLDELHYLANPKAKRSKAVGAYIASHQHRPDIVGLTGTPITARPRDLWYPLDILWPGRFGSFWSFAKRYCGAHEKEIKGLENPVWDTSGASNLAELGERLQSGLMLRREKSELLDLPPQQRIMLPVELPDRARKSLASATASAVGDRELGRALASVEEYKIATAIDLANDLRASNKRPLIFTVRRETAKQIGEALAVPYVTGEDDPASRREKLASATCGVATVYSVTTGIDLTNFDVAIFVGLDWVPSTLLQAEARIHRIGQGRGVLIYYLIGVGTIDEAIQSRVIERLDSFATVVGASASEENLASALRGGKSEQDLIDDIIAQIGRMT